MSQKLFFFILTLTTINCGQTHTNHSERKEEYFKPVLENIFSTNNHGSTSFGFLNDTLFLVTISSSNNNINYILEKHWHTA